MGSEDLHLLEWGELADEYLGPAFTRKFSNGDILYGSRRTYLRKVAVAHFDGITANTTFVIKPNEKRIVKELLPFVMLSEGFTQHSIRNSKGSVNPYINWKDIANYEFLLPPKEQQEKLAKLLWRADSALESALTAILRVDITRRAFIADCFAEKAERYVRLQDAAEVRYGLTMNSRRKTLPNQRPYLRVANVGREKIDLSEVKEVGCSDTDLETFILKQGDILVVEGHANIHEIGRSAIWNGDTKEMLHQNHLIRARCKIGLVPRFLSAYINSPRGRGYFQGMAKSTSGLNTINSTVVKDFKVPVIPKDEQRDFVTKLEVLENSQARAVKHSENQRQLLKSLINQIF